MQYLFPSGNLSSQVVVLIPLHQVCDLCSVCRLNIFTDDTYTVSSENWCCGSNCVGQHCHESAEWTAVGWAHSPGLRLKTLKLLHPMETDWGLSIRKSRIQLKREVFIPTGRFSCLTSFWEITMLNLHWSGWTLVWHKCPCPGWRMMKLASDVSSIKTRCLVIWGEGGLPRWFPVLCLKMCNEVVQCIWQWGVTAAGLTRWLVVIELLCVPWVHEVGDY